MIADLTGVEQIGFRQYIARVGDPEAARLPLSYEPHDRSAAEHNFVFGMAPMPFDGPGTYEAVLEVEVRGRRETHRNAFALERGPANLV